MNRVDNLLIDRIPPVGGIARILGIERAAPGATTLQGRKSRTMLAPAARARTTDRSAPGPPNAVGSRKPVSERLRRTYSLHGNQQEKKYKARDNRSAHRGSVGTTKRLWPSGYVSPPASIAAWPCPRGQYDRRNERVPRRAASPSG